MNGSGNVRDTQSAFPSEGSKPVESCPTQTMAAEQPATAQTATPPPQPQPAPPPKTEEKKEKTWVKIELVDMEGKPVPNEKYRIKVPNEDSPREGTLDSQGQAAYFDLDPGSCEVSFPDLDAEAWEFVSTSS